MEVRRMFLSGGLIVFIVLSEAIEIRRVFLTVRQVVFVVLSSLKTPLYLAFPRLVSLRDTS